MLTDDLRSAQRTLYLQIGNNGLRRFLLALLDLWSFTATDDPAAAQLFLVDEGCPPPPGTAPIVWLTPCPSSAPDRLTMPLLLEHFSATLEQAFHRPPRSHLRIICDLPLAYVARNSPGVSLLHSFSDQGARFYCNRELAPGETVQLRFSLFDSDHALSARVIYSFAESDNATTRFATGVIFSDLDNTDRQRLRDQVVALYLLQLRERLPAWVFTVGLSAFHVPEPYRLLFRA